MKKIILILPLIVITACGYKTPIIDGKVPFVVDEIKKYDETHTIYITRNTESGKWSDNLEGYPEIVLPSRMYNVGDTIKVFKK